jgi:hypothetical protein
MRKWRRSRLHHQSGQFECVAPLGGTPFERHGPLRVSDNRRYLTHADGTPFLWLADTAWNGPLKATDGEWDDYLRERTRQLKRHLESERIGKPFRARIHYCDSFPVFDNQPFLKQLMVVCAPAARSLMVTALYTSPGENLAATANVPALLYAWIQFFRTTDRRRLRPSVCDRQWICL